MRFWLDAGLAMVLKHRTDNACRSYLLMNTWGGAAPEVTQTNCPGCHLPVVCTVLHTQESVLSW
jgi:hypothetical protein